MTDSVLITNRRGFLVRALGITAAGATLSVPIVSVASAEERVKHHLAGLEQAYRDLYPGAPIWTKRNVATREDTLERSAIAIVLAGPMPIGRAP